MTAPESLVERLAGVLDHRVDRLGNCSCGERLRQDDPSQWCKVAPATIRAHVARALLPVVEQEIAAARAEALREAADARPEWQETLNREDERHFASGSMHGAGVDVACDVFEDWLRDRADHVARTAAQTPAAESDCWCPNRSDGRKHKFLPGRGVGLCGDAQTPATSPEEGR